MNRYCQRESTGTTWSACRYRSGHSGMRSGAAEAAEAAVIRSEIEIQQPLLRLGPLFYLLNLLLVLYSTRPASRTARTVSLGIDSRWKTTRFEDAIDSLLCGPTRQIGPYHPALSPLNPPWRLLLALDWVARDCCEPTPRSSTLTARSQ